MKSPNIKRLLNKVFMSDKNFVVSSCYVVEKLNNYMECHGMTLNEFANYINYPIKEVEKWMSGNYDFLLSVLTDLEIKLNIRLFSKEREDLK